jgi:hypothetical protein
MTSATIYLPAASLTHTDHLATDERPAGQINLIGEMRVSKLSTRADSQGWPCCRVCSFAPNVLAH